MLHWPNNSGYFAAACIWVTACFGSMDIAHAAADQVLPPKWPWHGVNLGFPEATPKDLARYHHELGINVVRLHLKVRQYAEKRAVTSDMALDAGLRWTDGMLDTCARLGIVGIVDISQFPLDPSRPGQTTPEFWQSPESLISVFSTVQRVVKYLSSRGDELVAYDFMSEPVMIGRWGGVAPDPWPGLLQQITTFVNIKDKKRWLLVSPGPWGGVDGYLDFEPPMGERLIWGAHIYTPHAFTHQGIRVFPNGVNYPGRVRLHYWNKAALHKHIQPLADFSKKHPGPVFIGEFSAVRWAEGGEQYLLDLSSVFMEQEWGFAYFSGSGWHGWNPEYNSDYGNNQKAKAQLVGEKSVRWQTLRKIFKVQGAQ